MRSTVPFGGWNRVGEQIKFNALSIREIGIALTRYRTEILRLIAQMSLGTGALALHRGHRRRGRIHDADHGRGDRRTGLQRTVRLGLEA